MAEREGWTDPVVPGERVPLATARDQKRPPSATSKEGRKKNSWGGILQGSWPSPSLEKKKKGRRKKKQLQSGEGGRDQEFDTGLTAFKKGSRGAGRGRGLQGAGGGRSRTAKDRGQ